MIQPRTGRKDMGVCYPSPPNPGQFRLCVDTRSPHFRVELSRAKMSPPQEDGVLPARFSSACLSLPTQWEFPGSWDPERKQRSQRPADWEGREDWLIGRLGGRRVKGVAGSGRDMLEPHPGLSFTALNLRLYTYVFMYLLLSVFPPSRVVLFTAVSAGLNSSWHTDYHFSLFTKEPIFY